MITNLLKEQLEDSQSEKRVHEDRFYPSQSSSIVNKGKYKKVEGKCLRAAYYHCLGMPDEDEFSTRRELIFKIGDYTEKMILDILDKKGVLVDKNVKFDIEKYNIYGALDGIILDKGGNKVGLEIKSIGSNKWTANQIFGSRWNTPFPKWQNLFQTLIYCYAFKDEISKFILFYIRRDTCETKEFEISIIPKGKEIYPVIDGKIYEDFSVTGILKRYKALKSYVEKKEVPPREFQITYPKNKISTYRKLGIISKTRAEKYLLSPLGDIECEFCSYLNQCKKDE